MHEVFVRCVIICSKYRLRPEELLKKLSNFLMYFCYVLEFN